MSSDSTSVTADRPGADQVPEDPDADSKDRPAGDADPGTPGADTPARTSPRVRRLGTALLAVLLLGTATAAGVLGWKLQEARAVENAAREAADVARAYAVTLTSVSADDLEGDFGAVLDGATGEFEKMYTESSEQLEQLLIDNQAHAEGVVVDSGIKSATRTKVEVLLFIDQSVTNALVTEPRLDRSRVAMTMELVDGRWLASEVVLP